MPHSGAGKYDHGCTLARRETGGSVLLIVVDGYDGSGFSYQGDKALLSGLPDVLEEMADRIRMEQGMPE